PKSARSTAAHRIRNGRLLGKDHKHIALMKHLASVQQMLLAFARLVSIQRNAAAFQEVVKEDGMRKTVLHHTPDIPATSKERIGQAKRNIIHALMLRQHKHTAISGDVFKAVCLCFVEEFAV